MKVFVDTNMYVAEALLALDPCEGLRIISLRAYYELLHNEGLLP